MSSYSYTHDSIETAAAYNPSYSYDKIGNRKTSTGIESVTYTANALNQYADIQVSSLSSQSFYDLDGNLTGDGGNWTYNWNNENRLASATDGSRTIHFTYDYQGRLVKKDDGRAIEVYVYDGWNRIATFDSQVSTLSLQVSYLWGLDLSGSFQGAGGVGGLLKEGTLYPIYDANGNIMQKLDGNGVTVMNVAYDPFGNIISGTLVGEYGFSTKPFVVGPDWYYYGFRYYDPVTGRWPSRDPLGEGGGLNPYASNLNNSINYWDYLGMIPCSDCPPCQIEETRYNNANNALDATVAILTATQNQLTNDTNAVNQANTNHAQRFVSLASASISVVSACNSNGSDDADSSGACAVAAANLALQFSAFTNAQDALDAANIQLQLTISYLDTLGDQYDVDLREFLDANAVLAACRSDRLTCLADCCP